MKHHLQLLVVAGLLVCAMLQCISAVDFKAYTAYDDSACTALGSISVIRGSCTSSACVSGAGVSCMTDSNYKAQIAAAFSVNSVPYVTISTFSTVYCPVGALTTVKAYAADGLCHLLPTADGGVARSFQVTVYDISADADDSSVVATISTYTNTGCTGLFQTTTLYKYTLTTTSGCSSLTQTELSLDWPKEVTPMALNASTVFDGGNCSKALGSISLTPRKCSSSAESCASGVGTFCTSINKYKNRVATAFTTAPYVTVWTFSGSVCTLVTLVTVQIYAADRQCHPIGSKFFKVAIRADLTAFVANYSDATCTTADGVGLLVTSQKLTAGCDNQPQASRYEVSANWPVAVDSRVYFDGLDCTKTVGSIQMTTTSSTCSATVCTVGFRTFCSTNYNYEATIAAAFGMIPYITVSTFSGNACTAAALLTATTYAADGKCHPIGGGGYFMVVTQSTAEQVMTIKRYTNALCSYSDTSNPDIAVTKTILTTNSGCNGEAQATQYKVSGTVQQSSGAALRAVAAFDDGDCTKALGSMIVAPGASCTSDSSCIAGTRITCTTNYNYEAAVAVAFGAARYVMVTVFWGTTCTWMTLESATAYAADGRCHPIGMKYFTASSNALISTYTDPSCTTLESTNTMSVTTAAGCNSGTTTRVTLSPNWFTPMDVTGVYAATSCTGTASKLVLTNSTGSACTIAKTCPGTQLSDCTTSTNYTAYLDAAFGGVPYLIMESYTSSNCMTRSSITAYAADGSCYTDGSNSFKVLPVAGNMALTTFTTTTCAGAGTTTTVSPASLLRNLCVNSAKYFMGGNWALTTTAVYDDSNCILTPSKISFTVTATCTVPRDSCRYTSAGYGTVYLASGCAKASSYMTTIDKAFGMTPYVVQETYSASGCSGGLTEITAYVADGLCHLGGDAATSYRVTWNPTSTTAAVKIETFSSAGCYFGAVSSTIAGSAAIEGTCVSAVKMVSVGGLTSKLTVVATYSDSDCIYPVQAVFSSPATTCITQSKCTTAANGLYMKQACATDYGTFVTDLFQTTRRLVTDIYEANSSSMCATRQGIVAYVGDGVCHPNLDGTTSFYVMLGATDTDGANLATYSKVNCTGSETSLTITAEILATGSCDGATSMKFAVTGGVSTEAPTPDPTTATIGSGISSATSFLSVSTFEFMTTVGGVIGGIVML